MKFNFLMALISLTIGTQSTFAAEVIFHIPQDTTANEADWNDHDNPLVAHVGDTLVVVNDDNVAHQLHALGNPFDHGDLILPGASWQTTILTTYDSRAEDAPLRDHVHAEQKFWLVVLP